MKKNVLFIFLTVLSRFSFAISFPKAPKADNLSISDHISQLTGSNSMAKMDSFVKLIRLSRIKGNLKLMWESNAIEALNVFNESNVNSYFIYMSNDLQKKIFDSTKSEE